MSVGDHGGFSGRVFLRPLCVGVVEDDEVTQFRTHFSHRDAVLAGMHCLQGNVLFGLHYKYDDKSMMIYQQFVVYYGGGVE